MDTNQPSNTLSRRKFVKIGATGAATLFILPALSGCGSENGEAQTDEAEGGAGAQQKTATLAFRGGTIQTMTSENDVAEALAVDGNEIVYVGDEELENLGENESENAEDNHLDRNCMSSRY